MTDDINEKAFYVSLETRKFEIGLFWKRSLFFWGFIASAFVGYATLKENNDLLAIVIAIFGFACSFCWALVNRGSKYWQENWETKIDKLEKDVVGDLFKTPEPVKYKGCWLSAKKYSVSKTVIAISDYVTISWFLLILNGLLGNKRPLICFDSNEKLIAFFVFTLIWIILILVFARTTENNKN